MSRKNHAKDMGFNAKWVTIMMRYVCTISYSLLINGKPYGNITPTRGLCQGEQLSPYFFLLCAEGLSTLLQYSVEQGLLKGVAACRGAPDISHLFFAYDNLSFCRATREECSNLERVLDIYELAEGQKLNHDKTSLFFCHNTPLDIQNDIKNRFGAEII